MSIKAVITSVHLTTNKPTKKIRIQLSQLKLIVLVTIMMIITLWIIKYKTKESQDVMLSSSSVRNNQSNTFLFFRFWSFSSHLIDLQYPFDFSSPSWSKISWHEYILNKNHEPFCKRLVAIVQNFRKWLIPIYFFCQLCPKFFWFFYGLFEHLIVLTEFSLPLLWAMKMADWKTM